MASGQALAGHDESMAARALAQAGDIHAAACAATAPAPRASRDIAIVRGDGASLTTAL